MRILILSVSPRFGSIGGIVTILKDGFELAGHTVKICYGYRGDDIEDDTYHKVTPSWEFKLSALLTRLTGYQGIFNPVATHRVIKTIESFQPDIVQLTNIHAYWLNEFNLLDYLKEHRIPTVYSMMDEYAFLGKCAFSYACERYKIGCGKCPNYTDYPKTLFFDRSATIYKCKEKAYRCFDNLYMVGGVGVLKKAQQAPLLKGHPVIMINEPQNFDTLFYYRNTMQLRKELGIPSSNKVLMCMASLRDERKGGHLFLDICKHLKDRDDISFVYIGFNTDRYDKPDNLIAIPFVKSLDKIAEYCSMADLLFFGSKADTTPNTILQSLGCGTPVVCFDIEGISCMKINDNAVLNMVPVDDLDAVENICRQVSHKDKELMDRCRRSVYASFNSTSIINQYLELYEKVLNSDNV